MNGKAAIRNFLRGMGSILGLYPPSRDYDKLFSTARHHKTGRPCAETGSRWTGYAATYAMADIARKDGEDTDS